jgi:hypothetical protein
MTVKEEAPSPEHQKLVGYLIKWVSDEGYQIACANYDNYQPCPVATNYKPDAKGYRSDVELSCYGESKTADDIDREHTKAQFKEFANWRMKKGKSQGKDCPLYITIPKGSEAVLQKVLREIDLLDKPYVKWQAFT